MFLSNWPLARRLSLAFAGVIGIFLTVIGVAIKSQNELKKADEMNQHTYVVLGVGQEMLQSARFPAGRGGSISRAVDHRYQELRCRLEQGKIPDFR